MQNINVYDWLTTIVSFLNDIAVWAYEHLYIALPTLIVAITALILVKLFT